MSDFSVTLNNDTSESTVSAYKGFDKELKCSGFQYEIDKEYEETGKIIPCKNGFHACEKPLDVFRYYSPATSRFTKVELSGEMVKSDDKIAASKIAIKAEISFGSIISEGISTIINSVFTLIKSIRTAATSGNESTAATSGDWSTAATSGNWSIAATSGYESTAATSGYKSTAATSGDWSIAATSGNWSIAATSGNWSIAATSGYESTAIAKGKNSIAIANGKKSRASACEGSWVALPVFDDEGNIVDLKAALAGRDIKSDTFYEIVDGELSEVENE